MLEVQESDSEDDSYFSEYGDLVGENEVISDFDESSSQSSAKKDPDFATEESWLSLICSTNNYENDNANQ